MRKINYLFIDEAGENMGAHAYYPCRLPHFYTFSRGVPRGCVLEEEGL